MTEHWFSTKRSFAQTEYGFDKRTRCFRKFGEFEVPILKKNSRTFVLFEKLIPSKWHSVHVEVSSENRAELFFPPNVCVLLWLKSKIQKSITFSPNTIFESKKSSVNVEGDLTIVSKSLLQKSHYLLLRYLKGVKSENRTAKTSEWCTEDAKCSFDNSAEKHFAKIKAFSALNPEMLQKHLSFENFESPQNKLLFPYVEGSLDNHANFSPSKARTFFWLNSKNDRKRKKNFK